MRAQHDITAAAGYRRFASRRGHAAVGRSIGVRLTGAADTGRTTTLCYLPRGAAIGRIGVADYIHRRGRLETLITAALGEASHRSP